MNKKKWLTLTALLCLVTALIIFSLTKEENRLHDIFWIPLVLSAVFLFFANRTKQ